MFAVAVLLILPADLYSVDVYRIRPPRYPSFPFTSKLVYSDVEILLLNQTMTKTRFESRFEVDLTRFRVHSFSEMY